MSGYRKLYSYPNPDHEYGSITLVLDASAPNVGDGHYFILKSNATREARPLEVNFEPLIGPFRYFLEKDRKRIEQVIQSTPCPAEAEASFWAGQILSQLDRERLVKTPADVGAA